MQRIIAADIGGTKTLIGLFRQDAAGLSEEASERLDNSAYASFAELLDAFAGRLAGGRPDAACIAFPGPVEDGRAEGTNIAWAVDRRDLSAALGTTRVGIVNDLVAAARGMLLLPEQQFVHLNPAAKGMTKGNAAVLAVGTGLGEAILHWDGRSHRPIATEGSHADFAPQSDLEIDLLRHLRVLHGGHVSWERVASGPGLVAIHSFLSGRGGNGSDGPLAAHGNGDPAAAISTAALEDRDPVCRQAVSLFARLLGAEAGNLALKCLATGGVFIGGGIPPQILPILQDGSFLSGFREKGRFAALMSRIPVRVALDIRAGLIGAAQIAVEL